MPGDGEEVALRRRRNGLAGCVSKAWKNILIRMVRSLGRCIRLCLTDLRILCI